MLLPRFILRMIAVALMVLGGDAMRAQSYPSKPIRFVTGGMGSNADFAAGMIGPGITAGRK